MPLDSTQQPSASANTPPPVKVAAEYDITPRYDPENSNEIYIPTDLQDCFRELDRMLNPKLVEKLKVGGETEATTQHFGVGLWIRNNWVRREGSRLALYFRELGIFHPDDMSGIILDSYVRYLNSRPIDLEAQIKSYQEFWEREKQRQKRKQGS